MGLCFTGIHACMLFLFGCGSEGMLSFAVLVGSANCSGCASCHKLSLAVD